MSFASRCLSVVVTVLIVTFSAAYAHEPEGEPLLKPLELTVDEPAGVTGQGEFRYRQRSIEWPVEFKTHIGAAHGGFAPDRRSTGGDGSTWFCLKGVGLLNLSSDLGRLEVIGGDAAFRDVNVHNTTIFRGSGATFLALPSDQAQKVYITTTAGKVVRTLPNPYGDGGAAFRVCDVEFVDGLLFAANGYADNVCFVANPFVSKPESPATGVWNRLRFGGAGKKHGRFGTAHGITRVPGSDVFTVSDRANSRLESYSRAGHYIGGIELPAGCMPCDVDYHGRFAVVGCLKGPGGSTPAPIYILEDGNIVSEINIGRDLGLEGFSHIHNAAFHVIEGEDGEEKIYLLAYAWNPGNFAILEPVKGEGVDVR
ncbi:MAG TPA: hypothetical protein EYN00_08405 [Planctomycetes bacterium]|nr:hypothetical protein [Planctomycetota bacterium]